MLQCRGEARGRGQEEGGIDLGEEEEEEGDGREAGKK